MSSSVFCDLPLDVLRLVLEISALESSQAAANLTLVCREVRRWIAPILYNNVVLSGNPCTETFNSTLESSYSAAQIQTLIFLGSCVPQHELVTAKCHQLHTIHIHSSNALAFSKSTTFPPELRQLVVLGQTTHPRFVYEKLPVYQVITHLAFAHDLPDPAPVPHCFSHLTHFACGYSIHSGWAHEITLEERNQSLEGLLAAVLTIPSVRIVLVLVQDLHHEMPRDCHNILGLVDGVPQIEDQRVVLVASLRTQRRRMRDADFWSVQSDGSCWALAEKMLREQRKVLFLEDT